VVVSIGKLRVSMQRLTERRRLGKLQAGGRELFAHDFV